MTDDAESSLSPAQDTDSSSLAADLAAALAEHDVTDDTDEPTGDSPEPEREERETEISGDPGGDADRTDDTDPQDAATQDAPSEPDGGTEAPNPYRQVAEVFHGVVSPYQPYLASKGVSAPQAIQALLAAEYQLSTGTPERKAQILSQLAKDYGVEVDALYDLEDSEPVNPEIAKIQQRQAVLERHIQGQQARVQAEQTQVVAEVRQSVEAEVAAFAEEKDSSGGLLRPHLKKVRDEMGRMIGQDPNLNIQEAYDNAVWADPKLRKANLAQQRTVTAGQPAKANKPRRAAKSPSRRDDLGADIRKIYRRLEARAET